MFPIYQITSVAQLKGIFPSPITSCAIRFAVRAAEEGQRAREGATWPFQWIGPHIDR